jgi:transketolase
MKSSMLTKKKETAGAEARHLDTLCINTIRTLAMDAVQKANSGHPGTPMALAPLAYVLWTQFLRHNPANPQWFDRDRFVLSNGHASMLQYAMLFLTGYDISLDDLKRFRQWDSKTPGHPEYGRTPGIETTTGPLGQGFMNAVGMAIAEAHLAAVYNRPGYNIVDHHTYVFCSDGDIMEGASHEAASVAGHLGLGKLIVVYDENHISIEGKTEITYSDDVATRFKGYHWHVQDIGDRANDIGAIGKALAKARSVADKPSLIVLRSHIGYGAPHRQDTKEAHGEPLGEEEVRLTKKFYGWPEDRQFYVPDEVIEHMRKAVERGRRLEEEWNEEFNRYAREHPEMATLFRSALHDDLPADWDSEIPEFAPDEGPQATRDSAGRAEQAIAAKVPWLIGGSGDLAPSTRTLIHDSAYIEAGQYANRNIAWGIREHTMCACSSGMALHGGVRPFASTFFIFTDYARPALRLACLMELPVIYVMTHDSIGLGEDGPTHQPVEHLASFRAMPHMCVIRPADANEATWAWRAAIMRKKGPTMLVLTRQKLPILDRSIVAPPEGLLKGAYVLSKEKGEVPDVILMGSGSEVHLLLEAQERLRADGVDARVVSMPSWELFCEQEEGYRNEVLPPEVKARLAVEAGASFGWCQWTGDSGGVIGVDGFGSSAPAKDNFAHYGFTVDNIVQRAKGLMGKRDREGSIA